MGYPEMVMIRQNFPATRLPHVAQAVKHELSRIKLAEMVKPGWGIAVAASARGIKDQAVIIKSLVEELKALGAKPFIIPAMGSHGGSTAEGQAALLRGYNITEEFVEAPVYTSIDVDLVGTTVRGVPVHVDRCACEAHGIALVNRVRAHIDFEGPQESGLYKMIAAGLGKPSGAKNLHLYALKYGFHSVMQEMARLALRRLPFLLGLGIVENAYNDTEAIKVLTSEEMEEGSPEAELLRRAKANMAKLPFEEIDLLIVDEIGKDIAGSGLDANVIGRKGEIQTWHAQRPRIKRIIICGLTKNTQGNALGMGHADFTTRKLVDRIDHDQTYLNAITANVPLEGKMPLIMENERNAVDAALSTIGPVRPEDARVVRIKNTLELFQFEASRACLNELAGRDNLQVIEDLGEIEFDREGNLLPIFERSRL